MERQTQWPAAKVRLSAGASLLLLAVCVSLWTHLNLATTAVKPRATKVSWQEQVALGVSVEGRVVLTTLTSGYSRWLEQWWMTARRVGLTELLVVALDWGAFDWLVSRVGKRHVIHFLPEPGRRAGGRKGDVPVHTFGSASYKERVIDQRQAVFERVAAMGLSLIICDSDIHWLSNPWQSLLDFTQRHGCHFAIQRETSDELGRDNCAGFFYLPQGMFASKLMQSWRAMVIADPNENGDQIALNRVLRNITRSQAAGGPHGWRGFRGCVLPPSLFPSGRGYFFREGNKEKYKAGCRAKQRRSGKADPSRCRCPAGAECPSKTMSYFVPMWDAGPPSRRLPGAGMPPSAPVLVHHNAISNNKDKEQRARDFGLWLDLPLQHSTGLRVGGIARTAGRNR